MINKTKQYKLLTLSLTLTLLLTSAVNYCNAEDVNTSTITFKNDMEALEFLAENGGDRVSSSIVFDGAMPMKNSVPVRFAGVWPSASAAGSRSSAQTPVSTVQQKGLKLSANVPMLGLGEPAKKQKSLDGFQTTGDGNLYRVRNDRPWWKFWDSSKVIEKSIPNANGTIWNEKGEFVGEWQKVMKTDTDKFQVVKGVDSKDHIYTIKTTYGNREVYKDGKFVTSFKNNIGDSRLADVKAGKDEKIYARYYKDAEDIFIGVDPATKKQMIVSRVPAELNVYYDWHTKTYTDSEGNTRTYQYREEHVERNGVTKFELTKDGKVLTLFKGNVFEEGNQRKVLAGTPVNPNDVFSDKVPWGRITEFKVDSYGNLYTVENRRVVVNNELMGTIDWSSRDLNIDDYGNVYKVDWHWGGGVIRQINLINDPANEKHIVESMHPA